MNYISTRNKKLSFNFQNIFFRGLAPDGGLFLPKEIGKFDKKELSNLSKLNYIDLGSKIIAKFCQPSLTEEKIKNILKKLTQIFMQRRSKFKKNWWIKFTRALSRTYFSI